VIRCLGDHSDRFRAQREEGVVRVALESRVHRYHAGIGRLLAERRKRRPVSVHHRPERERGVIRHTRSVTTATSDVPDDEFRGWWQSHHQVPSHPLSQKEGSVSSEAAQEILVRGARAVAHADSVGAGLEALLAVVGEQLDVESAVIVLVDGADGLRIIASTGLPDPDVTRLAEALRNPHHPIARTVSEPVPAFDVLPTVPGGPALRSHLPVAIRRDGSDTVLGVLALAHHRPLDAGTRLMLEAVADLAAVVIERHAAA
jgi:GAF domain-containing protein